MAAEDERGVSPFPQPPATFYRQYTDENVKDGSAPAPPPPIQGAYSVFGAKFDTNDAILRPLKDQNIRQLYPDVHDRKAELKKLNRSINVCFLELLDILIQNPASPARNQKISDLGFLFINMHHLINEFRPHQARETLKVILERQKKQREDLTTQIQRDMETARSILKECGECIGQAVSTVSHSAKVAQPGRVGVAATGTESILVPSKDEEEGTGISTGAGSKVAGSAGAWSRVEKQDAQLCSLVDSLIPNT